MGGVGLDYRGHKGTSQVAQLVKDPSAMQETWVPSDPLEKEMATHSSTLAWEISWAEEPGGLQFRGHKRVRHNLETKPPPETFYILMAMIM